MGLLPRQASMHTTIERLLRQVASLRYEVTIEKARRFPFRVFDRVDRQSKGQFPTQEAADSFRDDLIRHYVENELAKEILQAASA